MESDRPIQKSTEDRFGRWQFAQGIAQVIAHRDDSSSIVIGIHAPWGEGKTSVLNMIVEELMRHPHVLIIYFNPWRFPDEAQLLRKFFSTIATKIDKSLKTRGEKLSEIADKYAEALSPLALIGIDAPKFLKALASTRPKADLEELKIRFEKALEESGKRVVVIMDDIDRLDKEEVQAIFRLVKLSADFPNTAYILAFDDKRVAEALAEKYGGVDAQTSIEAGRSFLEKIIQVPLPLPPASIKALRSLAFEGVEAALRLAAIELSEEQAQKFLDIFDKGFRNRLSTPRMSKRFTNGLNFALPLLKGEVNILDLIFIEGVRTFYPSVYQSIRENEEVYLGAIFDSWGEKTKEKAKAQATAIIEDSLAKLSERDKKAAKIVIQELFPRTGVSGMFGMGAYEAEFDSDWAKEKRIAAKDYFHRYFTYGIPPHDISDNEIERFINEIPARDVDYVITKINEFAANKRADVLIQKLRSYEDHLSVDVAKPLALVLALGGKVLPHSHPTDNFFGLGIYAQVGMLIRRLVNHIEDMREREEFALDLAERTEPLPFAFEYSSWMRPLKPSRDAQEKVSVISEECKAGIRERIAARIAAEAYEEPLENRYPVDAQNLYRFWVANNQEQVRRYLEVRIREYPESAVRFLIGVLEISPKASDMPLDIPDSSGWYRLIATMVNPEIIMAALKQTYPDIDTIQPAIHNPVTENAERRAAKWFVRLHQQVSSESESDGEAGK